MLYTLAYPTLDAADRAFIDQYRSEHDLRQRDVVAPHFTLVFAGSSVPQAEYLQHVASVATQSPAIRFSCRYAMLWADDRDPTAYVFLVPDEGHGGLALLHDRLHGGILAPQLQLDRPYVPHITIATLSDRHRAKQLCDQLNRDGVRIDGVVDAVSVSTLENGRIHDLACYPLQTPARP